MKLDEAVETILRKRRRTGESESKPPPLSELRADEKVRIATILKEHRPKLARFSDIMRSAMAGAEMPAFESLVNTPDFTDGFLLRQCHLASGWALRRFLMEQGLDVMYPRSHRHPGQHFFQLFTGPVGIEHNLGLLRKAV